MKNVAIIGYGIEGQAAAKYWADEGARIIICDADAELKVPKQYAAALGPNAHGPGVGYLAQLGAMDLIVRSPGTRPDAILAANPRSPGLAGRITSGTREFFAQCPAPIIGVTGTKGKGTTSTLIARILEAAGRTVWLGGNIGRPALEFLSQVREDHLVVLELSSFQLLDLEQSPEVAVCLMIAPEHLNWHTDMAEYVAAKGNIFAHQRADDLAVYKAGDARAIELAKLSAGQRLPYGAEPGAVVANGAVVIDGAKVCDVAEVALVGAHNLENVCAAVTATWELVGHDPAPIRAAITSFTGLPHRLELAGEVAGVRYYDDSFSTTPDAAIAAIKAFAEPKVIILGGSDKGANFTRLAQAVEHGGVIHALLIGETAAQLEAALRRAGFTHFTTGFTDMPHLIETCYHITEPGDVVLLSPACASFGLFTDYKARGDQFKAAVQQLKERL
ncbi:MAG TPA: UDP-N-acetylmuramoyl-L-alanine--D-glutamate ligase [Candidatus Saccharimonadia bacterium]|nr:UDP-N-acetylmuramoyl-L-alanine--D-glutamate ligase [Candidatus Saccharimonadia bacterium]